MQAQYTRFIQLPSKPGQLRSQLPPWTGPRLHPETSTFVFSLLPLSCLPALSSTNPSFSLEFLKVLIQFSSLPLDSFCLSMSLLKFPDFRAGKGASGMFLAHHFHGSQKSTLLRDHSGETPCGSLSPLGYTTAGCGRHRPGQPHRRDQC